MERMKIGMRLFHDRPFTRVVRRECARIAARKSLFLLMIPLPIVLFFLLALMYRNQVVVGIPVAVYDADHSELSRIVIRSVESTRSMKIVASLQSIDEITEEFRKGNIQGAVYIPGGFEGDVKHGRQARIIFYKNSFNLILGNSLLKDGTAIAKTISAGVLIKKFRSAGMSYQGALDLANPVRLESYSLFNPNYNYENYFVPCLVTAVLQMVVMIGAVLLVSTEYHEGTMAELFNAAGGKVSAVIAGKAIPHLFIHSASALCLIGILFPLFGIPLAGSVLLILAYMGVGILASFFLGFFVSCLFHDQLFATELGVFLNAPAVIFSGYTFPLAGMPAVHGAFARILPFTHFFSGFIKLYQFGTPLKYLAPELLVLGGFVGVSLAGSAAILTVRKRTGAMKAERRKEIGDEE